MEGKPACLSGISLDFAGISSSRDKTFSDKHKVYQPAFKRCIILKYAWAWFLKNIILPTMADKQAPEKHTKKPCPENKTL